ncbi:MAG: hypothetical protein Greene041679_336 [Parcubacteria group bacterium Greene0416_79]|nr:MAG: hypothetical protein Greene041679_336 [Parcubacteria group bacterium Greene0416_79]
MVVPRAQKDARLFLNDVLTPTERLMIAKRLAAIVMLCREYSGYKIHTVLKVSPSTVARLKTRLEEGAFPYLAKLFRGPQEIKQKKEASDFWDALYTFILMGMPPRVGKGRWKFLFEGR